MIRSKQKFYWSDALYLARAKNILILQSSDANGQMYRCAHCSAFSKFLITEAHPSGRWERIKPYEHYQLIKNFGDASVSENGLDVLIVRDGKTLYRCPECASHWWKESNGWNKADDDMLDRTAAQT